MALLSPRTLTIAVVVLPFIVWLLLAPPRWMSWSTYAMAAALLAALAAIALNTWKNGQAAASMGQLLHEAEETPLVPVAGGTMGESNSKTTT